jgi:peptidoglycan/LPS O-acetylase OafA/YrhL
VEAAKNASNVGGDGERCVDSPPITVAAPKGNPRFPEIDAIRGIAALAIVFFHITQNGYLGNGISKFGGHLNAGVPLFFAISGFVLLRPYLAAELLNAPPVRLRGYVARRLLRIVPAYWLCLIVAAAIVTLPGVFGSHFYVFFGFAQIYSTANSKAGLGVAWSLCTEMTFYAALPLLWIGLATLIRRTGSNWHWAVILALAPLAVGSILFHLKVENGPHQTLGVSILGSFYLFYVGMCLAILSVKGDQDASWERLRRQVARYGLGFWVIAILAFVAVTEHVSPTSAGPVWPPYGIIGGLVLLPAVARTESRTITLILRWRPLAFLGAISYGVYLWHVPVIDLLRTHVGLTPGPTSHAAIMLFACVTVTVVIAWISFRVVESPLIRLARRLS